MTIWCIAMYVQCMVAFPDDCELKLIKKCPEMNKSHQKCPSWHTFSFVDFKFETSQSALHCEMSHTCCPNYCANWIQINAWLSRQIMKMMFLSHFLQNQDPFWQQSLEKPNSHFRIQFDFTIESDHLTCAIAGAMQNCNRQLLQCHFYWKHAPEWRKLAKNVLSDTHFRFCSPGFKLSNSFHVAKSITYTAPITVQIAV
jgi:hypothetical protein